MPLICPDCRGDLVNNTSHGVWVVTFSTLTSTAEGLDTSSFQLDAILDDNTSYSESLEDNDGVISGNRTVYTWTLTSPGTPLSATLEVEHNTLGTLGLDLTVSEQGAAA